MTIWVTVTIPGDINGDLKVSLSDLVRARIQDNSQRFALSHLSVSTI
jgi:hypothetical protein